MFNLTIKTIPHNEQLYDTCGDWHWDDQNLTVAVSDLGNWRYEALVALHEVVEAILCRYNSVSEEAVTRFDKEYEVQRAMGNHLPDDEPGDDPLAPYRQEHQLATLLERTVAFWIGVRWGEYEAVVNALVYEPLKL